MNVIVSNKNANVFSNMSIDVIKSINGEFSSEEIVQTFANFFFNRMLLDITAVSRYQDINSIKNIVKYVDASKIILFVGDDSFASSDSYISKLINLGIYNFAKTEDEIMYLYNNPNQYRDVSSMHNAEDVVDISNSNDNNVSNDDYGDVSSGVKIIGVKNFTNHAGATSLIYMLKKQLFKDYYTIAIEVNKRDFMFFRDKDMISVNSKDLKDTLAKHNDANIILVDLNDFDDVTACSLCTEIVYLVEPSTLSINKISMLNARAFNKLQSFKVVLNRCMLTGKDVSVFASEAGIKVFYSLPPMNDRIDNSNILFPFLANLGLYKRV